MTTGTLKIHSENILPIIKQWLYTEKGIFVRELVANACDAIAKHKVLTEGSDAHRIDIRLDKEARTLTFSDTGLGMTAEEVEKYIADVAFSGAEEFVQKYKSDEQIIGHFGLGFFSAFMVADKVEIDTLSYQGGEAAHWTCDGSADYTMDKGERTERGTTVTLHLSDDEFLEPARIRAILDHHCAFLPVPIYLDDAHINETEPLWVKAPSECTDDDYLAFFRKLYPGEPDPLLWVHLAVDYPFHLKGILYFPRMRQSFDPQNTQLKLFCNRVFVSDNCKDLVPDYLAALKGALDSPDIPLNVSRSTLQMDRTVRQLATHISKKVSDRLVTLYKNERERFLEAWDDLELVVKLGAIQDPKFYERAKEILVWKNTAGEWTTVEELLERTDAKKVFYTGEQDSALLDLYKDTEVLRTRGPIDTHLIHFLEQKLEGVTFQRIDGGLSDDLASGEVADWIKEELGDLKVEAKELSSDALPAFILLDEQSRRMRDYLAVADPKGGHSALLEGMQTLVVNTKSKLMGAITALHESQPDLAAQMLQQVVAGARMSQREMDPADLDAFLSRNNQILEKLISTKGE